MNAGGDDELTAALLAHFGPRGLRALPIAPAGPLRHPGLPLQVGPYFRAAEEGDPLSLGEWAAAVGADAGPVAAQLRIGTDGGAELYFAPDRSVRAVLLGAEPLDLPVSGSVAAFAAGLLLLDRLLPAVAEVDRPDLALAAYRELRQGLLASDPTAFDDREGWWPRVLDDLRRPLNIDSSAAFEVVDEQGAKRIVTEVGGPGLLHPEEALWHRLRAEGVEAEQVVRVYCELEPCVMPGHYCARWLAREFPQAEFTHSFDYGDTAESREGGIKALMISVAERRG
ncbi:nucleic acid/nucleotide deaminase domain-containing protein [Kitasatospora purpeofusca]|uniref:nucleic acid/nucleotide deaminase domain-containing protein n=1 Tax=Kitasatospora purpeofusca TaxID=67352 RepID=UPI002250D60F|nr:nucleic acid/nucleotide deaminase domain-containing protein [Kitasatospora purpeofusca]MCX4754431.1 SUKH-4 family immunity protein [Kitasatospora purpeofusca]WSR33852.1 SUKH-4 family immunity protein [Kitasatospora purpeofusca]WSR42068.1 SUKH-4 family immunity protein [Kitasatospora purpeofusca]